MSTREDSRNLYRFHFMLFSYLLHNIFEMTDYKLITEIIYFCNE